MKKIINWINGLFKDEKGSPSSKRFVGILGALTLFATLFANSFSHLDQAPSESLVNAVALLSFGALGITGAERIFSKNNKKEEKDAVE
jgi:fluoride ion exporter CrcB/FEX